MTMNIPDPAPLGDKLRIVFLGPFDVFTEQVVRQVALAGAILMPMTNAPQAPAAVRRGGADCAAVPIENSTEGGVNAMLDLLSHGNPLVIVTEIHVHAVFQLAVLPDTRPEDIRRVGTHPCAWVQRRGWTEETFPGAIHAPATSMTVVAELLSDGDASFDTALCNAVSVNTYGLEALFTDVVDSPGVITRFVLVACPGVVPPPTGVDKTTIQVTLLANKLGALLTPLEQFSACDVDLSRTELCPSGDGLGNCAFNIDIVGHIREERVQVALIGLHRCSLDVRFMDSYSCVGGVRASVVPGMTDEVFRAGRAWVMDLLHGGDGTGEAAGSALSWLLV